MDKEELYLIKAIKAARVVQEFLWGTHNKLWGVEEWLRMLRKRLAKLEEINENNPHASIEMRKRLLQTAALCIALMAKIDKNGIPWNAISNTSSNLPHYTKKVK